MSDLAAYVYLVFILGVNVWLIKWNVDMFRERKAHERKFGK